MINIRIATIQDLDGILAIENASFEYPWSRILFDADLSTNPNAIYWVAEEEGAILGFVGTHNIAGEINITNVAVDPKARKKHIGSLLIETMLAYFEDYAKSHEFWGITLEVRASNNPAIGLYEKYSFVSEGRRKGYYKNGEDALIMWRR